MSNLCMYSVQWGRALCVCVVYVFVYFYFMCKYNIYVKYIIEVNIMEAENFEIVSSYF